MARSREEALLRRRKRVRRKVAGTTVRPRLSIHRSLRHLYAQVIDDDQGRTICAVTTNTKALKGDAKHFANVAGAQKLGATMAGIAREKGVELVVFDRGGYRYHGVVKAFADAARAGGLKF